MAEPQSNTRNVASGEINRAAEEAPITTNTTPCKHCGSLDCYEPDKPTCDTQTIAELRWENRVLGYTVAMYAKVLRLDPNRRHEDMDPYAVTDLSIDAGERVIALQNSGSRQGVSWERARQKAEAPDV